MVFLDIRMPRLNGMEVAREMAGRCAIAFITSCDQDAIDAFEAGALDYVLELIIAARRATTVQQLKLRPPQPRADLRHLLHNTKPSHGAALPATDQRCPAVRRSDHRLPHRRSAIKLSERWITSYAHP